MAQCVVVDSSGFLVADAAPPSSCTGFIVATSTEFADLQGFWEPLSISDGATVGVAIFVAWSIAFGLRRLVKSVDES